MIIRKEKNVLHNVSIFIFTLYIITLFTFVEHPTLYKVSQISFILFFIVSIMEIIRMGKTFIKPYIIYFTIIPNMFLISYMWAYNPSVVIGKVITIAQISLLCIIAYHIIIQENDGERIINIILTGGIFLCIYSVLFYGPTEIINSMLNGNRIGAEISQENIFGMNAAITVIICFYKCLYKDKKYFLIIFLPFIIAMSSGSKKSLISMILGIFIILTLKYGLKHIFKLIAMSIVTLIIIWIILQNPLFESINNRMDEFLNLFSSNGKIDGSTQLRADFIEFGIDKFLEKPILGHGTSNYAVINTVRPGYYSHNNFIEILVNNGILGFIIYYSSYIYILFKLIKLIMKKDNIAIVLFTIIFITLIMQVAIVVFYDKLQYIYLMFGFAYIDIRTREEKLLSGGKYE